MRTLRAKPRLIAYNRRVQLQAEGIVKRTTTLITSLRQRQRILVETWMASARVAGLVIRAPMLVAMIRSDHATEAVVLPVREGGDGGHRVVVIVLP